MLQAELFAGTKKITASRHREDGSVLTIEVQVGVTTTCVYQMVYDALRIQTSAMQLSRVGPTLSRIWCQDVARFRLPLILADCPNFKYDRLRDKYQPAFVLSTEVKGTEWFVVDFPPDRKETYDKETEDLFYNPLRMQLAVRISDDFSLDSDNNPVHTKKPLHVLEFQTTIPQFSTWVKGISSLDW